MLAECEWSSLFSSSSFMIVEFKLVHINLDTFMFSKIWLKWVSFKFPLSLIVLLFNISNICLCSSAPSFWSSWFCNTNVFLLFLLVFDQICLSLCWLMILHIYYCQFSLSYFISSYYFSSLSTVLVVCFAYHSVWDSAWVHFSSFLFFCLVCLHVKLFSSPTDFAPISRIFPWAIKAQNILPES